eukprot:3731518-Pyramimonas_sp.AAC.1
MPRLRARRRFKHAMRARPVVAILTVRPLEWMPMHGSHQETDGRVHAWEDASLTEPGADLTFKARF